MIKLSELNIKPIRKEGNWSVQDPNISGIETNSSKIKKGKIFADEQYKENIKTMINKAR